MKEGFIENKDSETQNQDMVLINSFSRRKLSENDVYIFSVVLCDNEIDRDNECFSTEALNQLAPLYVGKTGIFDHSMKGKDQKARVFYTRVESVEGRVTKQNHQYYRLFAKAYMLRIEENQSLIGEIDAGIKKEVSVGCSMGSSKCSICGTNVRKGSCTHVPGKSYNGEICCRVLEDAKDAYEFSFVAVPAQPGAGVVKSFKNGKDSDFSMNEIIKTLKNAKSDVVMSKEQATDLFRQIEGMEEDAVLGQKYKNILTEQVVSLCALAMPEMDLESFKSVASIMTEKELYSFKSAFEKKAEKEMPVKTQLFQMDQTKDISYNEFKI